MAAYKTGAFVRSKYYTPPRAIMALDPALENASEMDTPF